MGYRIRVGRAPKTFYEQVQGLSQDEVLKLINKKPPICEEDEEPYYEEVCYRPPLPFYEELYEIGKHYSFDTFRMPFYSFDVVEECESEFDILTKRGFELLIEAEREDVAAYFKSLQTALEENKTDETIVYINQLVDEWSSMFGMVPYNMDPKRDLVSSWKREYAIFQLVHIYRSFDWENDLLIYSGW